MKVTTVAAAYSLSGFATDATDIAGSSATAVANAASSAANLASLTTGQALATTPGGNGTVPQDEISTLADILAECINSSGPTSSSCTALFSDAKSGGASGTMATDTATAAIYIAHNPGINLSTLVGDIGSSSDPFTDHLSSAPHDWTIAVTYTGGGLNQPNGIAVDGTGNIWTANQGGASISKFSTTGVAAATNGYPNAGLSTPKGIAIDGLGNVWVANSGNNTVSEYNGSTFSSPSGGTLSTPTASRSTRRMTFGWRTTATTASANSCQERERNILAVGWIIPWASRSTRLGMCGSRTMPGRGSASSVLQARRFPAQAETRAAG